MGLGLKVHVGHVLGLKHDLGLGVDPSYNPCWDHINVAMYVSCNIDMLGMKGILTWLVD